MQIPRKFYEGKLSLSLSLCGIVGVTAVLGIREKAHVRPNGGQTCVVSGAAGAVGSLAGQVKESSIFMCP